MKNIIFYHGSDFDGRCSGKIMEQSLPNADTWAFNHTDPFPYWFKPTKEDTVWFVDISTNPPERILELTKITNVMVIDHHESFKKWAEKNIPADILKKWVLDTSKAACQLCWEYTHPGEAMPRAVKLFATYDMWDRSDEEAWQTVITPFQQGMAGTKFDDPIWLELFNDEGNLIDSLIEKGRPIVEYQTNANTSLMKKHAFAATFKYKGKKLKALVCNTHNMSSTTFESIWDGTQYDLMIPYCCSKGKEYWISLYTTTDVNCGDIAFHFGGGGHPQAAGFTAKKVKLYERFGKRYIKFTV